MANTHKKTEFGPFSLESSPKRNKIKSRVIKSGLEMPRQVVFKDWEPGGEYTLPMVLKNVKLDTQKIHFQ